MLLNKNCLVSWRPVPTQANPQGTLAFPLFQRASYCQPTCRATALCILFAASESYPLFYFYFIFIVISNLAKNLDFPTYTQSFLGWRCLIRVLNDSQPSEIPQTFRRSYLFKGACLCHERAQCTASQKARLIKLGKQIAPFC